MWLNSTLNLSFKTISIMAKSSKKSSTSNQGAASAGVRSASKSSTTTGKTSTSSGKHESADLSELFEHGLRDILWAEKALTKAIPKMARKATNPELKAALEEHLKVTEGQIEKLNMVFEQIGKEPRAKKCPGMEGIITEGEETMEEFDNNLINAAIISAASKVEHYEMSSYMSLIALAMKMGLKESATILEEIFLEEQASDKVLHAIGKKLANS